MENKKTIELLEELTKNNPNDQELGKAIRAFILELQKSKKESEKLQNKKND